jgi:hypothetical protein
MHVHKVSGSERMRCWCMHELWEVTCGREKERMCMGDLEVEGK